MIKIIQQVIENLNGYGLSVLVLVLGILEFSFGLYKKRWTKNEKLVDIACFVLPKLVIRPAIAFFGLQLLPAVIPAFRNQFDWVSFGWGVLIIAIADDLTQYWYHRLHHEVPWLWRFHRTHHSAPYMGMAMASRQNAIYTLFFSQTYVTTILVYLGLGAPRIVVGAIKSTITTLAHSSIPWDKPFYKYKILHPVAWVLERLISTPATHHAHHAATTDDGVGYYKGNFGNMFFLWDIIFGTAHLSRQYPAVYGISHYEEDPWYAQLLWPIFKSNVAGSELAADGPMVKPDVVVPQENGLSRLLAEKELISAHREEEQQILKEQEQLALKEEEQQILKEVALQAGTHF
ncbi:sterol desaturase family protein [Pedobacter lusitanus]|uniref:sterol desaturase family protein n=1 Tax=Pedobacter lusitanus TaxID=1503925 RepID=UPI0009E406B5|nr:sterol desaturase family protein [Pedobacter lusitanus]